MRLTSFVSGEVSERLAAELIFFLPPFVRGAGPESGCRLGAYARDIGSPDFLIMASSGFRVPG
jgi:hypothetical protein